VRKGFGWMDRERLREISREANRKRWAAVRAKESHVRFTTTSAFGSDSWRKLGGPVCDHGRFIRQELLDQIVWAEVIRLLEHSTRIQRELDRRLEAARASDPTRKREQSLQRELTHVGKGIERLLNAYQEGLLSIEQLRQRMPVLRQRQQALSAELAGDRGSDE
jgi:site-specific DNA recombinase